jgi:hypothetical protein
LVMYKNLIRLGSYALLTSGLTFAFLSPVPWSFRM